LDEEVRGITVSNKTQFKWQKSRRREDWVKYISFGKKTKRAVSKAKFKKYELLKI